MLEQITGTLEKQCGEIMDSSRFGVRSVNANTIAMPKSAEVWRTHSRPVDCGYALSMQML